MLRATQTYSKSSKLSEYAPDPTAGLETGSDFSLILQLSKEGWRFELATPSKKTPPYGPGKEKVWYYHEQNKKGGINQQYLGVLAKAETLFQQGLQCFTISNRRCTTKPCSQCPLQNWPKCSPTSHEVITT